MNMTTILHPGLVKLSKTQGKTLEHCSPKIVIYKDCLASQASVRMALFYHFIKRKTDFHSNFKVHAIMVLYVGLLTAVQGTILSLHQKPLTLLSDVVAHHKVRL